MTSVFSVIIAGIIPSIIGYLWYEPHVFGAQWMRYSGIQPERTVGKHGSTGLAFLGLVLGISMAYVLQIEIQADTTIVGALAHVFLLWIGFVAAILASSFLWERKPFKLYLIGASYWLLSLGIMTAILFYYQ